jgi:hypothetical protein
MLGEPAWHADEPAEQMACMVGGLGDHGEGKDSRR